MSTTVQMKHAVLITADGEAHQLTGRFVVLSDTYGDKPTLSVVNYYRNGREVGDVVCDSLRDACDAIAGWSKR